MSVQYDYLEKMFRRLDEARSHKSHIAKQRILGMPKKRPTTDADVMLAENWVLAVEYSIRDYISTHGQEHKP